ncbi:hypothetical protein OAL56_00515 [Candidatus Pelagibacter sp.]|nr:hypothetical protein [Candidatus Pelagibacter sp.]
MKYNNIIIYDGECPICKNFLIFTKLKEYNPEIKIINARENPEVVQYFKNLGYTIDDGFILVLNEEIYYGDRCLQKISKIINKENVFRNIFSKIFKYKFLNTISYPFFKFTRSIILKLIGIKKIDN